jgi:NitT/TauT family transport system permease protein
MTLPGADKPDRAVPLGLGPRGLLPNLYDVVIFILMAGIFVLLAHGAREMGAPLAKLNVAPVTLDPANLPEYALRTTLRMFAAILISLLFTFVVGTLAAKSRKAELIIVPALDILQSVPILGFLTFTVIFFLRLFPGSQLGAECAAIFAIFTSQAWNMTFSYYQSLRAIPSDLDEMSRHFGLSSWLRFVRLELPFSAPGLIWNTMMSMSGGWFFVVASEAIAVGDTRVNLPGIGSWLALAIEHRDITAVALAVAVMGVVILAYDQLIFRPIVAWADKFRFEQTAAQQRPRSWVLDLMRRGRVIKRIFVPLAGLTARISAVRLPVSATRARSMSPNLVRAGDIAWLAIVLAGTGFVLWLVVAYPHLRANLGKDDVIAAIGLGFLTLARVMALIAIASLIWVPIGVWVGLRPWAAERAQPIAQFLAAFPANVLMVLGTQWYILFNVVAGASAFPTDLREASIIYRLRLLAMVAHSDPARNFSVLYHGCPDGVRRLLEREHRGGSR